MSGTSFGTRFTKVDVMASQGRPFSAASMISHTTVLDSGHLRHCTSNSLKGRQNHSGRTVPEPLSSKLLFFLHPIEAEAAFLQWQECCHPLAHAFFFCFRSLLIMC